MIGHWLSTLTNEQEDLLLGRPFRPIARLTMAEQEACGCMVLVATRGMAWACGTNPEESQRGAGGNQGWRAPGWTYEYLCRRFGTPRVNAAIRNRILSNRARRVLGSALVCGVPAPHEPE